MSAYEKCTEKEKVFIDEFLKTNNRTEAYMAAFKNVKKRRTAGTKGSNLLKKDYISEAVKERKEELHKMRTLDMLDVLAMYSDIANGKEQDGFFESFDLLAGEVEAKRSFKTTPKTEERLKALDSLARIIGPEGKLLDARIGQIEAQVKEIEARTVKLQQQTGDAKEEIPDDGFLDALREEAADIWSNEQ